MLTNVSDFDHFAENSDLKNTFIEVMHKHGIPIGNSTFQINLAQQIQLPKIFPIKSELNLKNIELNSNIISSSMNLRWDDLPPPDEFQLSSFELEQQVSRVQSFSELSKVI